MAGTSPTSFSLSREDVTLFAKIRHKTGLSATEIIRALLRDYAAGKITPDDLPKLNKASVDAVALPEAIAKRLEARYTPA